ncbi:MAG TPA: hypothetical protein VIW01_03290 [Dehalococcoidia bacterium]
MKGKLSAEEREALLIKLWMSHDARWFAATAMEFGMEAANRLNQTAIHEAAKREAPRLVRAFEMSPVRNRDDFLTANDAFIGLLGPDLLDFEAETVGDDAYDLKMNRCFAFDQVKKAGVAQQYDCGILPRITGWLEGLGLEHELSPSIGPCLMAAGKECVYRVTVKPSNA